MPDTQVLDMFLGAASVCVIVLTLLVAVGAYVAIRGMLEARALIKLAHDELEAYQRARARLTRNARFAGAWARAFGRHIIRASERE